MHYTGMATAHFTADGQAGAHALGGRLGAKLDPWLRGRLETAERRREAQKLEAIGQLAGGIAHD